MRIVKIINKAWTVLGKANNNKALSSLVYILALSATFTWITTFSGIFGSLKIVEIDNLGGLVIENSTNDEIVLLRLETESEDWSQNLEIMEKISPRSIYIHRYRNEHSGDFINNSDLDILSRFPKEIKDKCIHKVIFSEIHPQYIFLKTHQKNLTIFNATSTIIYIQNGKNKFLNFKTKGVIQIDWNCINNTSIQKN